MQLEFHLFETQWMLSRGKYKNFLSTSDKHLTQHYQQTELHGIQLQIQLIRRLLYCRLRVLRKYFIKFPTKQHKILGYLDNCMNLCHMMQAHLVKCQDVLTDGCSSCNRKLKLKQFSHEMASPRSERLKQYLTEFENEPWERKSQQWYHFQEQCLFVYIQEVLMYQYMYFKLTNLKEAVRFLQKLVQLKFVKVYKSILLFNEALTLLNTAYFELTYSFQNVILEPISSLLLEAIKEYYRPNSNQAKCKRQMKQLTQLLIVNLDLESKALEYKDKYDQASQVISMANFFCQHILYFVGKQQELINYIQSEYEYKHEKYEQVIVEQQDLNQFVSFLLGAKVCTYAAPQINLPIQAKFAVESKNQYYTMRSRNRNEFGSSLHTPKSTPRSVIHLKKCKSPESQSYLSKLINLRNLSDHKYDMQNKETQIQKHLRELLEKLQKLESPEQFRTIDEVFHNKVHQITFEKCLTLDQVKETARKIIGAEWEVHKEMPVTKSLMKLISVSDIQLEGSQQQYNKLQEYMELQKIDFHNTQKDEAQLKLKENKDLKKLQINQQKYQMKLRHQKVQQQLQIPKKLLSLQTDETGLSPKFLRRNTKMVSFVPSVFERLDPHERRGKEYRSAQKQLMDLMVQNLEQRDELDKQKEKGHFVNVLPKSITRLPSPTSSDCKKSFAFSSNNSTRLEITKL